jgi:SpoVK/Ycf46/Vps4 family AAA+-type ATPase
MVMMTAATDRIFGARWFNTPRDADDNRWPIRTHAPSAKTGQAMDLKRSTEKAGGGSAAAAGAGAGAAASAASSSSASSSGASKRADPPPRPPPLDLELELSKIVGLDSVKAALRNFQHEIELDKRRRELGFGIDQARAEHMCFMGNPGTGKTTVARLVARILADVGIVENYTFVEVQRSDLVEGYIGQTAKKTRAVIDSARGGCLFVDEAYRLVPSGGSSGGSKDFGTEAINELMSAMQEGGDAPVMMFAGYIDDMKRFFRANEGLTRRIPRQWEFEDMSVPQLVELSRIIVKHSPFSIAEAVTDADLLSILERHTTAKQRSKLNGGLCSLLLRLAKEHLDRRLTLGTASVDNIMTYTREDLVNAAKRLPMPP